MILPSSEVPCNHRKTNAMCVSGFYPLDKFHHSMNGMYCIKLLNSIAAVRYNADRYEKNVDKLFAFLSQ